MTPSISPNDKKRNHATPTPPIADVLEYLRAFYHGMEVRLLENPPLEWVDWENPGMKSRKSMKKLSEAKTPDCIGLSNGQQLIRIESRPSPDGVFSGQLNQNHLFEVVLDIVPKDAYALIMVLHHDLFEDEEDDFCCGRAYGKKPYIQPLCETCSALFDMIQDIG
jgi:archaemetzincin